MKKIVSIVLTIALSLSLVACGNNSGETQTETENSSNVNAQTDDASQSADDETTKVKEIITATDSVSGCLDPAGFALADWTGFARLCSEPLMSYSDSGEEIMGATESYTVSDDQLTWTFTLREDGMWSDGSEVVADDFLNTIYRALDPENSDSIYANMLYGIVGAELANMGEGAMEDVMVTAVDDHTLEIQLNEVCPYFTKLLTLPVFFPSKTGVATSENAEWYKDPATCLCNGPFMLTEYVADQSYTVEKNPYYYNIDEVKIDKIITKAITDTQSTIAAYEAGEIDACSGLPDYIETEYADSEELTIWNMITTTSIVPNTADVEVLGDKLVRQAISLALSRDTITASMGANYDATYTWVPKYMLSNTGDQYFCEEEAVFSEDAELAKELLAEAGYPNGEGFPTLTLTYSSDEKYAILSQAIQAQLKAVLGIDIELEALESQTYRSTRFSSDFDLLLFNWTADFNDPINYLSLYTSDSGLNNVHMSDAAYDEAIANSNAAIDPAERNTYLHEAETILTSEEFYVIPLLTMHYVGLRNADIVGVTYNDKGEAYYTYADVE